MWEPQEVIDFCRDCIANGIKAVSLGGGEPFEYDGIFEIIDALYPLCYLSVTSNGLPLLNDEVWEMLMSHKPDKLHITIHRPDNTTEVEHVFSQIIKLKDSGIKPGVNLLVGADKVEAARNVYRQLIDILEKDQIIVIPQRFSNTPTPRQLASVADGQPFQSPSCLLGCRRPDKFASVSWNKMVNSCSYAPCKQPLEDLTFQGMISALEKIEWKTCSE